MKSRNNNFAVATATSHGVLPLELMFDILVRLPAKAICRLRTVCRPWRSLTSDPAFVKAHTAHQGPLIMASYSADEGGLVHVKDLSGGVIKRVPIPSGQTLMWSNLDLICAGDHETSRSCCLIDPATGAACRLQVHCFRDRLSLDHHECMDWPPPSSEFALGRVDSTGEYKMLMVSCLIYGHECCHVLTVNGGGGNRWRPTENPKFVIQMAGVVVGGAIYYFTADYSYVDSFRIKDLESDSAPDFIASFDLETEHWSTIPVPCLVDGNHDNGDDEGAKLREYIYMWSRSTLAELKGYLVVAHNNHRSSSLDMWFLKNIENRLWVKEYSIQDPGPAILVYAMSVKPLLLLDDGRTVFFLCNERTLLLYDPMTKVFSEMETGVSEVALYTGSLLAECLSIQRMVAGV